MSLGTRALVWNRAARVIHTSTLAQVSPMGGCCRRHVPPIPTSGGGVQISFWIRVERERQARAASAAVVRAAWVELERRAAWERYERIRLQRDRAQMVEEDVTGMFREDMEEGERTAWRRNGWQ